MHVLDEIDPVAVLLLRNMRRHAAEREKVVRFEELDAVFAGKAFVGKDFIL